MVRIILYILCCYILVLPYINNFISGMPPPQNAAGGIYKLCKFTAEIDLLAMSITSCYSL